MVGRSGVEVCPDCAVVQGTRSSVRKKLLAGKDNVVGSTKKEGKRSDLLGTRERGGASLSTQRIRVGSRFIRPAVENELNFRGRGTSDDGHRGTALRAAPSVAGAGRRKYLARVVVSLRSPAMVSKMERLCSERPWTCLAVFRP